MRSSEPGGRQTFGQAGWELWNLRALWPDAGPEDLADFHRRRGKILAREREALVRLWSGDRGFLAPGHGFFRDNPELRAGVTVSLHVGPYWMLPEPYLAAGCRPLILSNPQARASWRKVCEHWLGKRGYTASPQFVCPDERGFVRHIVHAVRSGRPVLIYIDGHPTGSRADHRISRCLNYPLPGRMIRVRTGLARLVCRLGCPVHPVVLRWRKGRDPVWTRADSRSWKRSHDPQKVVRYLYGWGFGEILQDPTQWHGWSMLRSSYRCFGTPGLSRQEMPQGLRQDFHKAFLTSLRRSPGTVKLILTAECAVWPPDVLADLQGDRFYPAEGLTDTDLEPLRARPRTLADLVALHGQAWVQFHGLRLCLLGLARLGG